jgi:hypothetical protein
VHDAVGLERRGIPTVTVCTERFLVAAQAQAEALGVPDLRLITIPAIDGAAADDVRELGRGIGAGVLELLGVRG